MNDQLQMNFLIRVLLFYFQTKEVKAIQDLHAPRGPRVLTVRNLRYYRQKKNIYTRDVLNIKMNSHVTFTENFVLRKFRDKMIICHCTKMDET